MAKRYKQEIFLEELPRYTEGLYKDKINWTQCINYKVRFIYDDIQGIIEICAYNKETQKLIIKYNNNEINISTGHFQECQIGKLIRKMTPKFKVKIGTMYKDEKRDITIIDRKYIKDKNGREWKYYKYECNICGFDGGKHYSTKDKKYKEELWIEESSLIKGIGCSCCANQIVIEGINDIPTTTPWMIKYFPNGYEEAKKYNPQSGQSIYPICPICHRIQNRLMTISNIYKYDSAWCSCGDGFSYPSKFAFNMLEKLGVDFETEYNPDWIKPKAYDFYFKLNNKEYILEMDGALGHGNKSGLKGKTQEESKAIDDYKDEQANEHGIEVIRIDCNYDRVESRFAFILNNILDDNKLNKLFDLDLINWNECNEFALSNLVKVACDLWNSGIHSTGDIGKLMKLSYSTVWNYLKEGSVLKWCDYTLEDSEFCRIQRVSIHAKKMYSKSLICIETGQIFESCAECERKSLETFGVKLSHSKISLVCRSKRNHTGGYHFKYLQDLTEEEISQIQEQANLNQAM